MPSPAAWIPLPDGGDDGLASVYGVTEWNGRLVATGSDGHARGAIWVSNDGIVWQSATVPDPPPDLGVSLGAPFVVGDRLMVFGTTFYPAGSGPVGSVAWTSTDGMAWTDTDASAQLGSSPLGLVGIRGQTIVAAEGHETPSGSAFWVSDDGGASWQRSAIDPDDGWWAIHGLAHGDGFVAVGTVFESFVDEPTATVWTSEDGLSWQRTALGPGRVNRIVEMGDGTLLVVGDDGEAPMGWTSTDGRTWSRSDIDLGCCGNEFTVTPSGFVAVQGADDGSGSVVYSSSDGLNWSVAGPLAGEMRRVAWTETFGVVISGLDTEGRPAVVVGWGTE
jgi:hypothetical protein